MEKPTNIPEGANEGVETELARRIRVTTAMLKQEEGYLAEAEANPGQWTDRERDDHRREIEKYKGYLREDGVEIE